MMYHTDVFRTSSILKLTYRNFKKRHTFLKTFTTYVLDCVIQRDYGYNSY